jgi:uncharacterized protein YcnI
MKRLIAAICGVVGATAVATGAHAGPDTNEAARQAWAKFTASWSSCGGSAVTAVDITAPAQPHMLPPRPASYHTVYIEARNVKPDFRAPGPNLSPADQQNGIERKGAFYFYSQTYREISIGKDGTRDQWSEWRNGTALSSVHLTYRHGAWEIVEQQPVGIDAIGRFARVRQPACSEAAS